MPDTRIMIVEDETLIALDIENSLSSSGYTVVATAYGGDEAIRLALVHRPDLMLVDINLGTGPDGIDVVSEVRNHIDAEVIFITAYDDRSCRGRALSSEPAGYLTKPVKGSDLFAAVELAIVKKRAKSAENARKKSEEFFRTLFNGISDGVFFHGYDEKGMPSYFIEVNEGAIALLNMPYIVLLQKKPQEIFDYGDEFFFREMIKRKNFTSEATLIQDSGESIPVEISNRLKVIDGSHLTLSVCRDISERKRNEEKLKKFSEEQACLIEELRTAQEDLEENIRQIREKGRSFGDSAD